MYKVIKIIEYMMTRDVIIENLKTGTVEKCFDDSDIKSDEYNFDFTRVGEIYDCKILLFGDTVGKGGVLCKVIDTNVVIGVKKYIKIQIENDEYYIPLNDLPNCNEIEYFRYNYSRKDLIQVNDTIHADLFEKY